MDIWKKHALVSLENDLKVNLGMTDLVGRLERPAGGFMTELERKHVEEVQGGSERVGRIIGILRGKGNKEFDTFLKILKESGNEVWADKIEASVHQFEEYHRANDQFGLKAIEYHTEGGSDISLQLSHGGQVNGEGGTRVVYVPVPVLQRKRSLEGLEDIPWSSPVKRTIDEYRKMKEDLERQDMKSVYAKCDRAIRLFYANAISRIKRLLEPHLCAVKDAAIMYLQLGLHEEEKCVKPCDVQSAESISELLSRMSVEANWESTCFLQQAVDAIPAKAIEREIAEAILSHYNLHLAIYAKATLLKDNLARKEKSGKGEEKQVAACAELITLEITSSKSLANFTCEDCHHIQIRILSAAFGIPADKIICHDAEERQSTTVMFLIPNRFIYIIMQRSTQLETVWVFLELDIIEVAIAGFTFRPSKSCFLTLLQGSKSFTADLLRVTEILPYQIHCLIDPGTKEPLSGQPLAAKRIAQPGKLCGKVEAEAHIHLVQADGESVDKQALTVPSEGRFISDVDDKVKTEYEVKENVGVGNELLSRVQELEDELKKSEQKRMELIHGNIALQNKLKASQEKEGRIHQEMTSLEERLLPVLRTQVQLVEDVESEISALQKKLIQQAEKYDHDMEVITQSLPTSDPITTAMLNATTKGSQSTVQHVVKRIVNVEDKNGRTPLLLAAERGHTELVRMLAGQYEGEIFHEMKNSQNALHLAAYRGHLPVLQYLCPMFGDRVLDRDGNGETCLDIALRLGRRAIAEFLMLNFPQLEKSGADRDSDEAIPSDDPSRKAHHHRKLLKVSAESRDVTLLPSSPMKQAKGGIGMDNSIEFRKHPKSKPIKAVGGTEWMYRKGAMERGRRAANNSSHLHQFTRYHQCWLADYVYEEEEESCSQWFLHQSPEMTTVKEAEEYRPGRVRYRYTTTKGLPAEADNAGSYQEEVMSRRAQLDPGPPLSILSYHGLDVIRLLCVEDLKLHLLQTGALTDGEYDYICQPEILRRRRFAAEKVWEALKTKPDGFQRLVKALEANVAEANYNCRHEDLLNILKGPDFEFEKLKSLVGTRLSDKMCLDVVRFLLRVKVSEGRSLIHPSVLQGCNTWRKLFQQLERCRLCHALDTDLLLHAFECVDGDVTNLRPILQRLVSFKSSEYPVQEKAGLVVPLPGFFLMAVHTLDSGLQMNSRLRQLKDTLSETLAVTKPFFQYLSTFRGVYNYQFPLRYLEIVPEYLQSSKVYGMLSRAGITHITIRSDSQTMEFDLASASMDAMSSSYTVAYSPVIDHTTDLGVSSSRHVTDDMCLAVPLLEHSTSPILQKSASASSAKSPTADKDPEEPEQCVTLSPGMHRRFHHVHASLSWSPAKYQRRPCTKRVHTLKLFLVGPKGSGKSTFLQSYMGGRQCTQQQPGVDVKDKVIFWNRYSDIRINVWDMPGTDFDQPTKDWAKTPVYREADGFIFVADMSRFDESLVQIKDLRKKASGVPALESRIPMVIVVNKCDSAHASGPNKGQVKLLKQFIQAHKFAHYFTTSAKMDIGVQRVFEYVAARVLNSESEHIQSMLHLEQQ